MKTLTILFESPNVFKVLTEWPNIESFRKYGIDTLNHYNSACEQSKANAIKIEKGIEEIKYACYQSDQRITGPYNPLFWEENILKSGDIFQVDGFEYRKTWQWRRFNDDEWKNTNAHYAIDCQINGCETREVAILKLAKEEPKEIPLPNFLYLDSYTKEIRTGVHGDTVVTDEWNRWINDLLTKC
jgi:hypothetical protein